jgi:hypothetical protein
MTNNAFVNAVRNTPVRTTTTNGMAAFESTCRANVDLFSKLGASRGKDITQLFNTALIEDSQLAIRIALWGRDIRGGAGERKLFRDMLLHLEKTNPDYLLKTNLLLMVPELGRWDDLLIFQTPEVKHVAHGLIYNALKEGHGLAAKWMPRKGKLAVELRQSFGMSPKRYRKTLVMLTKVVETTMCAREFETINFNHVPSLAMSRYTKAFAKRAPEQFTAWKEALKKGDPKVAKVNAAAVYPYDVLKTVINGDSDVADAQWEALPNFIGDANVLPLVDVSGSMTARVGNSKTDLTCMHVAISLGLYCASKNTGAFRNLFVTFSERPRINSIFGTLSQRYSQMRSSEWGYNTNLEAALEVILDLAKKNRVPQTDMPNTLLILSDMQFDSACGNPSSRALEMIRDDYRLAGYEAPAIVFWNLNSHDNVPVKFDDRGAALVSGFSPTIMKSVLSADLNNMTPEGIMRRTVMVDRYDFG